MTNENVDTHSPEQAAAWLRKRADENRRVAALPPDQWPRDPGFLQHLAFRFEQMAEMIEHLEMTIIDLRRIVREQREERSADESNAPLSAACALLDKARGALSDIASSTDMTLDLAQRKADRMYRETEYSAGVDTDGTIREIRRVPKAPHEREPPHCPSCACPPYQLTPENTQAEPGSTLMSFTHWSKDPLIPYTGCICSSCEDMRKYRGDENRE